MSETYTALEIDAQTGIETIRELTSDEIAERQELKLQAIAMQAEAETKANARLSALAKLADLGLTQDEINAL